MISQSIAAAVDTPSMEKKIQRVLSQQPLRPIWTQSAIAISPKDRHSLNPGWNMYQILPPPHWIKLFFPYAVFLILWRLLHQNTDNLRQWRKPIYVELLFGFYYFFVFRKQLKRPTFQRSTRFRHIIVKVRPRQVYSENEPCVWLFLSCI